MKQLFIAGNWKSNKTIREAQEWLEQFSAKYKVQNAKWGNSTIVLCVPFTLLYYLKQKILEIGLPIELGAQDVSPYGEGAYTGQVSARMVKELADWVIIGHSERRKYFSETDELLKTKVILAKQQNLKVIYCVPDEKTPVVEGVDVVAYEPVWAIGTGKTDTPENANNVIETIKKNSGSQTVIYGGSVTEDNVATFVSRAAIDGVLPGGASLDPEKFFNLIVHASSS